MFKGTVQDIVKYFTVVLKGIGMYRFHLRVLLTPTIFGRHRAVATLMPEHTCN